MEGLDRGESRNDYILFLNTCYIVLPCMTQLSHVEMRTRKAKC